MIEDINTIEDTGSGYAEKLSSGISNINTNLTNLNKKIASGINISGDIVNKTLQLYNLQKQFIDDCNTNIKKLGYTSTVSTTEQVSTAINSLKTSWNSVISAINNKLGTSISTSGNFNPSSIVSQINNASSTPDTVQITTVGGNLNWMGYTSSSNALYNIRSGRTYVCPYGTIITAEMSQMYERGIVDFTGDFWYVIPDTCACDFNYYNTPDTSQGTTTGYGLWSVFGDLDIGLY